MLETPEKIQRILDRAEAWGLLHHEREVPQEQTGQQRSWLVYTAATHQRPSLLIGWFPGARGGRVYVSEIRPYVSGRKRMTRRLPLNRASSWIMENGQ